MTLLLTIMIGRYRILEELKFKVLVFDGDEVRNNIEPNEPPTNQNLIINSITDGSQ